MSLNPGMKVVPKDVQFTSNGTPRLILEDDSVITANKDFVAQIHMDNHHKYITDVPNEVKIKKFVNYIILEYSKVSHWKHLKLETRLVSLILLIRINQHHD